MEHISQINERPTYMHILENNFRNTVKPRDLAYFQSPIFSLLDLPRRRRINLEPVVVKNRTAIPNNGAQGRLNRFFMSPREFSSDRTPLTFNVGTQSTKRNLKEMRGWLQPERCTIKEYRKTKNRTICSVFLN
jgi:hypothetical protein